MCIRDRSSTDAVFDKTISAKERPSSCMPSEYSVSLSLLSISCSVSWVGMYTVSYTHLDVYKRQEQCRLKRQKSFQIAQLAKETVAKKERPMLHNVPHDPSLPGQWEAAKNEKQSQFEQSNQNLSQASSEKKWYKFW